MGSLLDVKPSLELDSLVFAKGGLDLKSILSAPWMKLLPTAWLAWIICLGVYRRMCGLEIFPRLALNLRSLFRSSGQISGPKNCRYDARDEDSALEILTERLRQHSQHGIKVTGMSSTEARISGG